MTTSDVLYAAGVRHRVVVCATRDTQEPRPVSKRSNGKPVTWAAIQSEAQFQARVVAAARLAGFKVYHTHNSLHSEPGFPDLVLVKPPVTLFRELKSERGVVTTVQQEWLDVLAAADQNTGVWRPSDWSAIREVLGYVE